MNNKSMYAYETNLRYTSNKSMVYIAGTNKKELEEYFKNLGVEFGKRHNSILVKMYLDNSNYLESQRKTLIKYLETKKIYKEV